MPGPRSREDIAFVSDGYLGTASYSRIAWIVLMLCSTSFHTSVRLMNMTSEHEKFVMWAYTVCKFAHRICLCVPGDCTCKEGYANVEIFRGSDTYLGGLK